MASNFASNSLLCDILDFSKILSISTKSVRELAADLTVGLRSSKSLWGEMRSHS